MDKRLLVDVRPFEISRQKIDESIKENNGKLVVKGVLQRAESKNQNGRIYPREVLLREVGKYLDTNVQERRILRNKQAISLVMKQYQKMIWNKLKRK